MAEAVDIMGHGTGARIVKMTDVYGRNHYVRDDQLADESRVMLRLHTSRGRPFNISDERHGGQVMLNRGNL